jgi:hypothetical protein
MPSEVANLLHINSNPMMTGGMNPMAMMQAMQTMPGMNGMQGMMNPQQMQAMLGMMNPQQMLQMQGMMGMDGQAGQGSQGVQGMGQAAGGRSVNGEYTVQYGFEISLNHLKAPRQSQTPAGDAGGETPDMTSVKQEEGVQVCQLVRTLKVKTDPIRQAKG